MTKLRRGGCVLVTWKGDHSPRHVHVYRDGVFVLKWDLEAGRDGRRSGATGAASHREPEERRAAVKIDRVRANNRKRAFEVRGADRDLLFPYAKSVPVPCSCDHVGQSGRRGLARR